MAPKHEKGNTTGDHDAADARVRRARALYASISSISVLDFCYAGSIVQERRRPCRPLPPGPTIKLNIVPLALHVGTPLSLSLSLSLSL